MQSKESSLISMEVVAKWLYLLARQHRQQPTVSDPGKEEEHAAEKEQKN